MFNQSVEGVKNVHENLFRPLNYIRKSLKLTELNKTQSG